MAGMKVFFMMQIDEAEQHSMDGGIAIHLHNVVFTNSPRCFVNAVDRGEYIAHLLCQNKDTLTNLARKLGVNVIVVEREGESWQHVDLCGMPLRRLLRMIKCERMILREEDSCR